MAGRRNRIDSTTSPFFKSLFCAIWNKCPHSTCVFWGGKGGSVTKIMKPCKSMHIPDKDASILRASMSVSAAFWSQHLPCTHKCAPVRKEPLMFSYRIFFNKTFSTTPSSDLEFVRTKVVDLIQILILKGHLYLRGVWLGVDLRTDTTKTHV